MIELFEVLDVLEFFLFHSLHLKLPFCLLLLICVIVLRVVFLAKLKFLDREIVLPEELLVEFIQKLIDSFAIQLAKFREVIFRAFVT
jgi:hypothetical protein